MADDAHAEQVRLIQADLAQANELIKGVTTVGAGVRTVAITAWLGLLGFAFQQKLAPLAFLAVAVSILFWATDAYHGWIYAQVLLHASAAERVLGNYYSSISRSADDPTVRSELEILLRSYEFGCYGSIRRAVRPWNLLRARPTMFYRYLYPSIAIAALVIGILLSNSSVEAAAPLVKPNAGEISAPR